MALFYFIPTAVKSILIQFKPALNHLSLRNTQKKMPQQKRKILSVFPVVAALALILLVMTSVSDPDVTVVSKNAAFGSNTSLLINPLLAYSQLNLKDLGLNEKAFQLAVKGWLKLKAKGHLTKDVISICDFTQSSNKKRLYVIDLAAGTLLFNTLVAHGKNTGDEFARYFSNNPSSLQSSLGFYVTKEAYTGSHGLGLKLMGIEPGFNDRAEERAIVMHGANYVCNEFIDQYGRLGKSWGCPAVPFGEHEQIINAIKDGSCLFIYFPDKAYLAASKLLR